MRILRLPEVFFNTQIVDLSRVAQEPGEGGGRGAQGPEKRLSENENRHFAGAQHFCGIAADKKLSDTGMAVGAHDIHFNPKTLLERH